jgi:hypothetical protein
MKDVYGRLFSTDQVRFLESGRVEVVGPDCLLELAAEFSPERIPPGVSMVLLAGLKPNDGDRKGSKGYRKKGRGGGVGLL